MKRKTLYLSTAFTLSILAASIQAASDTIDVTFTSPVIVGETDRATGRVENVSPEAKRLGVSSIRLLGEVKAEQQQGENRMQVRWTDVSVDNAAGESVSGTLERPLESRFRTQAPAVRPGNTVKARGDVSQLNETLQNILTAKDGQEGAGKESAPRTASTDGKQAEGKETDRISRKSTGGGGFGSGGYGNDPDNYYAAAQLTPANEACAPLVDKAAGTVTPQTKRVVMDPDGNVIADGGCVPSGTAASIQTDYQSCPVHIDHEQMRAYRTYRKFALVDGKSMEVQGCTVDFEQEIERKRDYAACTVMIPEMQAGKPVYPSYRWVGMDRDKGKEFLISDCVRDTDVEYQLESITASCPDYVNTRQDGRIYPQEKLVYRDHNGVEHLAVNCRRVENHPGFAVIETHEGCDSAELKNAAGKILIRPKTRLVYYDADGVQRQARACEPSAETAEVRYRVTGWKHGNGYSELMAEQIYTFDGIEWYWKGSSPSVFARVNHDYTTAGCSAAVEDLDAHVTKQTSRALLDVRSETFDPVRDQLNVDENGFVQAKGCSDAQFASTPHILVGWSDWRVTASKLVKEELGRLELGDSCAVTWSNDTTHQAKIEYTDVENGETPIIRHWTLNNLPINVKWKKTVTIPLRELKVSDFPSGVMFTGSISPKEHYKYHPFVNYSKAHNYSINNAVRTIFTDGELTSACQTYRGSISKPVSPAFTLTNPPTCVGGRYEGCSRDVSFTGNLLHTISWVRSTIPVDTGTPFTWANPESPWKMDTGCVARENPAPGDSTLICSGYSQTRERVRLWKKPIIAQNGSITGWEQYEDLGMVDRQVGYLVNE